MKFRNTVLALSILTLTACSGDDSPTIEELEAAQAGVEFQDSSEMNNLGNEILTAESAKKACAIQLSQVFGGDRNSPVVIKSCDCIVNNISLADINNNSVLEANKAITNECVGN